MRINTTVAMPSIDTISKMAAMVALASIDTMAAMAAITAVAANMTIEAIETHCICIIPGKKYLYIRKKLI